MSQPPLKLRRPAERTIAGLSCLLREGKTTCRQIVADCLAAVDAWEPSVRAWVSCDRDSAVERAEELDAELRAGKVRSPLHGMPIGIKDIIDVRGLPTAAGSALRARTAAANDATAVRRLREAGAILLGKTVTTQFAFYDPPITANPWNFDRTPGGSSSGSAAAVATGMCLGALGSQTGGSITRPAAYCGICGLKPTYGRVSLAGVLPLAESLDHLGPLAGSVTDLLLILQVIAGPDVDDRRTMVDGLPAFLPVVDAGLIPTLRFGRLRGMFTEMPDSEMCEAIDRLSAWLGRSGATVEDLELPAGGTEVLEHHYRVMAFEAAEFHRVAFSEHPADYLPGITKLIRDGQAVSVGDYQRSREFQLQFRQLMRETVHGFDALITPAALGAAPDRATTGSPAMNAPWSFSGLPTVNLPIELSREELPLGVQLVGKWGQEGILLRVAAFVEQVLSRQCPEE